MKTVSCITFTATEKERKIIEEIREKNYRLNQSEVVRMLINEGAKALQKQERKKA